MTRIIKNLGNSANNITVNTSNFNKNLTTADNTVQKALETLDELVSGGGGAADAADLIVNTASFNGLLTLADNNAQTIFNKIDDINGNSIPTITTLFNNNLSASDDTVQKALDKLDDLNSTNLKTTTSSFNNILSSSDDTIQKALDTLDNINSTTIKTITTNFNGFLSPTHDTVQKVLDKIDDSNFATFEEWSPSKLYSVNSLISINSILLICKIEHTSSSTFDSDIDKWQSLSPNVRIINIGTHSFSRFSLIAENNLGYQAASINSDNTLCTHVVLYSNSTHILIADNGTYTFTAHGITGDVSGLVYCGTTPGSYTSISGTLYENKVIKVIDINTISVLSNEPVIKKNVYTSYQSMKEILWAGSELNNSINTGNIVIDPKYTKITIDMNLFFAAIGAVYLTFNNDNNQSGNVTRHHAKRTFFIGANTSMTQDQGTQNTGFLISNGQAANTNSSGSSMEFLLKRCFGNNDHQMGAYTISYFNGTNYVQMLLTPTIQFGNLTEVINRFCVYSTTSVKGYINVWGVV